ncbi:MAG TPA: type II toxin-antitoxin system HicB family antitoxin [Chloroflexota bacterium]|nr:type II toxin-antitoxin system HicB family antitoxin [Chloroflexota bacterium]
MRDLEAKDTMTSYILDVIVEPDEDVWRAYIPALEAQGAATWGHSREEALRNIQEVAQLVIEELIDEQCPLPEGVPTSDHPHS